MSSNIGNGIIQTIHRYRKYVKEGKVPDLYCSKNDGTHLPLVAKVFIDDSVYLYCYTCGYEKQAGIVTKDWLENAMREADARLTS